jgi:hypothetical protein
MTRTAKTFYLKTSQIDSTDENAYINLGMIAEPEGNFEVDLLLDVFSSSPS